MTNLKCIRTSSGGIAPALAIDKPIYEAIKGHLAKNLDELRADGSKCVIAEFDTVQSVPIVRKSVKVGSRTLGSAIVGFFTGRSMRRWVYWANGEGLRLIAHHGSPARAFAAQ